MSETVPRLFIAAIAPPLRRPNLKAGRIGGKFRIVTETVAVFRPIHNRTPRRQICVADAECGVGGLGLGVC
jgi:hypothetical protein